MRNSILRVSFWGVLAISCAGRAQTPAVTVFHPDGPMPSYEVATIKPVDPGKSHSGVTLRRYIAGAFGVPMPWGLAGQYTSAQVVGGPGWIDKDGYEIKGVPADDLRAAMDKMGRHDRQKQDEMLQQSLLAERFHLKVHIETREMSVLEVVPAKGGIKLTAVDPPPQGVSQKIEQGKPMPAGMTRLQNSSSGVSIIDAKSTTMMSFLNALRGQAPEIAGRPVIDMSGFTGNFDVMDFRFVGVGLSQQPDSYGATDTPSLGAELEEKLGLKLVAVKAPVEVVVIDSIDRPTKN